MGSNVVYVRNTKLSWTAVCFQRKKPRGSYYFLLLLWQPSHKDSWELAVDIYIQMELLLILAKQQQQAVGGTYTLPGIFSPLKSSINSGKQDCDYWRAKHTCHVLPPVTTKVFFFYVRK